MFKFAQLKHSIFSFFLQHVCLIFFNMLFFMNNVTLKIYFIKCREILFNAVISLNSTINGIFSFLSNWVTFISEMK